MKRDILWDVLLRYSIHFFTVQIVMHTYCTENPILLYIWFHSVFQNKSPLYWQSKSPGCKQRKLTLVDLTFIKRIWGFTDRIPDWGLWSLEKWLEANSRASQSGYPVDRGTRLYTCSANPPGPGHGSCARPTAAATILREDSLWSLFLCILSSQLGACECVWVVGARSHACLCAQEILEEQIKHSSYRGRRWQNPLTRKQCHLLSYHNDKCPLEGQKIRENILPCSVEQQMWPQILDHYLEDVHHRAQGTHWRPCVPHH